MLHKLSFADDEIGKKRFEYLFHGLIVMGNQSTQKGLSVLNREISILDKLEQISKPCECGKIVPGSQEPDRELDFNDKGILELILDPTEIDLLYDYISKVPWSIGTSSREALKTLQWLRIPSGSPTS